jgi:hypothetical protein
MNSQLEEQACLYALDRLGPEERASFEALLANDPGLSALVREYEETVARTILTLPRSAPPENLLARIEDQIDRRSASPGPAQRTMAAFPWSRVAKWGLAAVIAASLGILALRLQPRSTGPVVVLAVLEADRTHYSEVPLRHAGGDADARFVQLASLAESLWEQNRAVRPGQSHLPVDRSFALFDPGSLQGFLAVRELPAVSGNQRYLVWLSDQTTGGVWFAGMLPVGGPDSGLYCFLIEPTAAPQTKRPGIFITLEERDTASTTPKPQGRIVLGTKPI